MAAPRILFLHGRYQNAKIFNKQCLPLQNAIRSRIAANFITVEAPFIVKPKLLKSQKSKRTNLTQHRSWWLHTEEELANWEKSHAQAYDIEPALNAVIDACHWPSDCCNSDTQKIVFAPPDFVLGFSQGAVLSALMLTPGGKRQMKKMSGGWDWKPRSVFFTGYLPDNKWLSMWRDSDEKEESEENVLSTDVVQTSYTGIPVQTSYTGIPSLHVYGDKDQVITPKQCEKFAKAFKQPEACIVAHTTGHRMPNDESVLSCVVDFITQEKNMS